MFGHRSCVRERETFPLEAVFSTSVGVQYECTEHRIGRQKQLQLTPYIYYILITNHLLMSGGNNSKQNHNIKIINKSFESVTKFKYYGMTLTNDNFMHGEIKMKLNSANACFRSVHNTGLFEMIVGVLTTCHTKCTWDRSICVFLFNRKTLQVFVTYLIGALYVHPLNVWNRTAIETIAADMLQTVWNELDYRVDVCRITKGAHIEHR